MFFRPPGAGQEDAKVHGLNPEWVSKFEGGYGLAHLLPRCDEIEVYPGAVSRYHRRVDPSMAGKFVRWLQLSMPCDT